MSFECRHTGPLAARWDYVTPDESSATGWIVCRECLALLERVSATDGRFRGSGGRFFGAFQAQVEQGNFSGLRELEPE
jgi:hypothetical protein